MGEEKANMLASIIEQFLDKKTDSISLSKTSTGKFSWDIKLYNPDLGNEANQKQVIERLKSINQAMKDAFPNEG